MSRRYRHAESSALLLLAVFVMGGLLAPVVHRAHHGVTWAALRGDSSSACDHSRHGDRVEVPIPSFQDDGCLLCDRHVHGTTLLVVVAERIQSEAALAVRPVVRTASSLPSLFLIRGPPHRA